MRDNGTRSVMVQPLGGSLGLAKADETESWSVSMVNFLGESKWKAEAIVQVSEVNVWVFFTQILEKLPQLFPSIRLW